MSSTGLARPVRHVSPQPHRPPRRPPTASPPPPMPRNRAAVSHERIFGVALAGSVVAHLLILLLSPLFITIGEPEGAASQAVEMVAVRQEIQLINPVPSENAPDEPVLQTPPLLDRRFPTLTRPGADAPIQPGPRLPSEVERDQGSAADALRPGYRDNRLYVNPRAITAPTPRRSEHQRYMEHLQARIDAINDSTASEAERQRRATDWSTRDGQGRRWGLSPEGLHLGGLTIPPALLPKPGATGDNAQIEGERERERQREEIHAQEERREREATRQERARAIRERNDSIRRRQ